MAPAGNLDSARLAIEAGADSIYAGVKNLSMRPKRVEFTDQSFAKLVNYVHSRQRKIYATMNICPKPMDIDNFKAKLAEIASLEVDAVIVSDLGMIDYIHQTYPQLPIHVSIMASVVNIEAAKFYKEHGVEVALVSRSLNNLEELSRISKSSGIDIELFVHGGICYMYDGICYMSSYWKQEWDWDPYMNRRRLMGQNNTKGECHLICKRPCTLSVNGQNLASGRLMRRPDDIGLEKLPEYLSMGVKILKIEGRAMPMYYIEEATRLYRQAIDLYLLNPEKYQLKQEWMPALERVLEARREYERKWHIG